ncbi:MAG: MlaC/ttg2D family ABC transporter substrate-binding protein [Candidatus Binatia bacterium]
MFHLNKRLIIAILFAVWFMPELVLAGSPTQQVQETIHKVLNVVNNPVAGGEAARKQALRDSIMSRFDWAEMAKQAMGKHWDGVSARHSEFIAAFTDFLGNSYVGKIGSYKDEKILFVQEIITNNLAEVKTKIVPTKGEATSVNYQLHQVQGDWKIYDVVVEDISLVVNYRAQFSRILAKGSFDDLLRQLKEKEARQRN